MSEKKYIQIGSTPEKALSGEYKIDAKAILKEGWLLTKTTKQPILSGLLLIFSFGVLITLLLSESMGGLELVREDPQSQMIINIVVTLTLSPFIAGVEMMGISHAVGLKSKTGFVFQFLKRSAFVAIAALFISSLTSLGMYLIIPGIYLAVALSLAIPLIVEKGMSPTAAIVLSIKATRFQWLNMFKVYLALLAAAFVCILPFAIGVPPVIALVLMMIGVAFLAPWYYNVKGILYREIFGVTMQVSPGSNDQDMYFSA